jgi:hypothetical protein
MWQHVLAKINENAAPINPKKYGALEVASTVCSASDNILALGGTGFKRRRALFKAGSSPAAGLVLLLLL